MTSLETLEIMSTSHLPNFNEFDYTVTTCLEASERLEKHVSEAEGYVLKNIICQKVGQLYIYYTDTQMSLKCYFKNLIID